MRIIAGQFRGRKLLPPKTQTTRPITDRVKQSVFDILSPSTEDAIVYDCFAGTGSMGLEAISRGAASAIFFENDAGALTALKSNIAALGVQQRARVIGGDIFRFFRSNSKLPQASLIFLDPPYRFLRERPESLRELAESLTRLHLSRGGMVVFRHDAADRFTLEPLQQSDGREYGSMVIEFLVNREP